jgi:hypothetical protein
MNAKSPTRRMTPEEHRKRHIKLHKALDELLADYLQHQRREAFKVPSEITVLELMHWSHIQTANPTEP